MFQNVVRMQVHDNSSASLRSVHGKRDIKRHPHVFMIAPAHVDKVDNVDSVDSVDRQHYVTADC